MAAKASISMKDVAALAGVSLGTVSNVINSPQLVTEATRERVEVAIAKLGWVPNESARQLRAGRSRSIGMVVMDIGNPFFTDVLAGAEDAVHERGYTVQVGNSAAQPAREANSYCSSNSSGSAGALRPDRRAERADQSAPAARHPGGDRRSGQRRRRLLLGDRRRCRGRSAGRRRTCSVWATGCWPWWADRVGCTRSGIGGWGPTLRAPSTAADVSTLIISTTAMDAPAGRGRGRSDRRAAGRRTADGGLRHQRSPGHRPAAGLRHPRPAGPEDIAIIGYDDISFAASAAVPLSSIRQPRETLGRRAAELLFDEIAAADDNLEHEHQSVRFSPELIIRRSTAGGGPAY